MGKYPVRTVETMRDIIRETEESPLDNLMPHRDAVGEAVPTAIGAAAVELARHVGARAIVVTTHSGYSARTVARYRPERPIYAATDQARTRQQLLLTWGVTPIDVDGYTEPQQMAAEALTRLRAAEELAAGDTVVVVSGLQRPQGGYDSSVRVVEV